MCGHAPLPLPQTYVQFWPTQGEDDYGRFHVQLISEEPGAGFTTWTLVLSNRQQVGPLLREMANSFEKNLCKSWEDELSTGFNLGSKSQLEMAEGFGGVLEGHWPEQGLFPWERG